MTFYIAILDENCEAHYFAKSSSAIKYLQDNVSINNCTIDTDKAWENGELYDETGVSVGYFYKVSTED